MGKGGAQLGKLMKGRSKETKREAPTVVDTGAESYKQQEHYVQFQKHAEDQYSKLKKKILQDAEHAKFNERILKQRNREVLRDDRVRCLQRDIEVLAQNHERTMDRKAAIIQMLTKDLDDAEEQFQTSQRTQMDKMQALLNLHNQKLSKVNEEFERDTKDLQNEFETEKKYIVDKHKRETNEMVSIISQVQSAEDERNTEANNDHDTEKELIRGKKEEGINELKIRLDQELAELAKKFNEAHDSYRDQTKQNNTTFNSALKEDASLSDQIGKQKETIDRLVLNLSYWKKKIEYNAGECQARNNALRDQKQTILRHCNGLKQRMKRFRADEDRKLAELTSMSRSAIKSNEDKLVIASRVIQLAELARKYQTEREKVTPFYQSSLTPEQEEVCTMIYRYILHLS